MDSKLSMLKYYKSQIFYLKNLLNSIDPTEDNLAPLFEIQQYIIDRILNTEVKICVKKAELKDLKTSLRTHTNGKKYSTELKLKINNVNDSLAGYKFLLYVWRCFGDGIVFKYSSKWNLKRLFFEVNSSKVKQKAGYIGGKQGIYKELDIVKDALSNNIPAVLCDITNSLRHGDVCLLDKNDPHIIEVKSSSNTNKRVKRQIESIDQIHSYLKNNIGDIGGVEKMRRVEFQENEVHHNSSINEVIRALSKTNFYQTSPEPGLHYVGVKTGHNIDFNCLFNEVKEPVLYMLNEGKTDERWDNYYPFTLSIQSAESLYSFLSGKIFLFVVVDGAILKKMFKENGYDLEIVMTEDAGFVYSKIVNGYKEPFYFMSSEHLVGRLGFEFISLEWFLNKQKLMLKEMEHDLIIQVETTTKVN
ncbi:hypothetical protein [Pseudoalteromonas sp. NZS11_1]|uniref:hypothetical protein n=1 Tax=Pseudoalteromonas sp. NZS11_1 TaxID=2792070 RepID=UPI0018CDB88D|nr:hypothetical protein [Pseudoalteromonas sp. NZS11_1]MBH0045684.1 hypothetical protein [Pseudoalteromonas sp. NZS11_1]